MAANKDGVPGGSSEAMDHNPAYNISAALTYTTQLVNVLAFYLDVRLPNKLCYRYYIELKKNELEILWPSLQSLYFYEKLYVTGIYDAASSCFII